MSTIFRASLLHVVPAVDRFFATRHDGCMFGSGYVTVDGMRLYCRRAGSGPPLLLLHGFLFSHRCWQAVLPQLTAKFAVFAVDLPGHGESDRPSDYSYSYDALVHTLADLLDKLELSKVSVVGHSLGGGLALLLAGRYPERVQRLVLVAPHVFPVRLAFEIRLALIPGVGEFVFKKIFTRRDLERFLRHSVYLDPSLPTEEQLQFYWERFNRPGGRDAAYRVMKLLARADSVAAMSRRVTCPVQVVRGERDRLVPASMAKRLAEELARAELITISGTRHAPMEERPDAFIEAVLPFLEGSIEPSHREEGVRSQHPKELPTVREPDLAEVD